MSNKKVYPVLLASKFKKELEKGGKMVLELAESDGVLGFAWRVFVVDVEGTKSMLVRKTDIEPHEIKSPNAVVAFAQKYGVDYIENLPVPDPKKYKLYTEINRD